ncbi:MAG TPA: response regulator transcription factor [Bacteroidota bacterium]|nr:response regulator transcription factor [Bacteroidota bacterium]
MRILVVDDHEFTREGVIGILSDAFSVTKVARAGNYNDAVKLARETKWDLMVVDINLADISGLELIKMARKFDAKVPILVLSMVPVAQYLKRILQAGATGYITKSEPTEELVHAVRLLMRGMKYFSPQVQQEMPAFIDEVVEQHPVHAELSDREFEILRRLAEGKTTKDIAIEYKISASTVNEYRRRLLTKLHAKSNLDLMSYAYQNGIVGKSG